MGIRDNKVSMGHARSLIGIDDPRIQLNAYNQILLQELSVRKTEELVRKLSEQEPEAEATPVITSYSIHYTKLYDVASTNISSV